MIDSTNKAYYFGWLETPNIVWTTMEDLQKKGIIEEGQPNLRLKPQDPELVGDVTCDFRTAEGKVPKGCHAKRSTEKKEEKSDRSAKPKAEKTLRGVEAAEE